MLSNSVLIVSLNIFLVLGVSAASLPSIKEFVELYQLQQGRPCTIVSLGLSLGHRLFIPEDNPFFQFVFWDIDLNWDLNEIMKEDKTIIEDLIKAAHNNAKSQLQSKTSEEISKATGGFGIPGFKWPL